MKKLISVLLAAWMLTALLAGCSSGDPAPAGPSDDNPSSPSDSNTPDDSNSGAAAREDINIWGNMMIDNYNPVDWSYAAQNNLFESVYSTLIKVSYKEDGSAEAVGDLAESWETEQDGAAWVFHLNPDAKFTNGEPVTADDVKFSFEACAQSAFSSFKVASITGIEVRDEHTVVISTGTYDACAPWCWHQVAIVEADAYQAGLDAYMAQQIGSGPYVLESLD